MSGLITGTTHLCQGQEAVPVGAVGAMRDDDYLTITYRGHGHALMRGVPMESCFAELMGRSTGCCRGVGGSMHFTDVDRGLLGAFAIVGAGLPVALGAAYSAKLQEHDRGALTFFGDGASNIGTFHESLNVAAAWSVGIVFIVENNLCGEYTPLRETTRRGRSVAPRDEDVPVPRPLSHRPCEVSTGGRARPLAGARSDHAVRRQARWGGGALARGAGGDTRGSAAARRRDGRSRRERAVSDDGGDPGGMSIPAEQTVDTTAAVVEMTVRDAVNAALHDEMAPNPTVYLVGEDVANDGGVFKTNHGLPVAFPGRVKNTPICENTFIGVAIGMSVTGLRPVVEIMFSDFLPTAGEAIASGGRALVRG
jgi:Dehydrogenase E1 component/Transketolase, pyrimidine binding domain